MVDALTVGGLFVLIAAMAVARRRSRAGSQVLRLLLPSWRLFDGAGHALQLAVRVKSPTGRFGPWRSLGPSLDARAFHPNASLTWGARGLLAQLAADLDDADPDTLGERVSYRLVRSWAAGEAKGRPFQFRLSSDEDLLISAVHEA